ncbi:hemolysin family protein [Bacillus fonticola]|uniref:hemolysin family protein n=1 Tax=Bacillus fonticola TaxID=2728853 RepID=UPI0014761E84|nr:hemolysin family protein [Bacillus fonticola]
MEVFNLVMVAFLIVMTAFFVASEFAIVRIRSSRVDTLVAEGRKGAEAAKTVTTKLDAYLSACQLGITITALGLGWLGKPTVKSLLNPMFNNLGLSEAAVSILSFTLAFVSITFLHVVFGELVPKTFAIQKTEAVTLLFSRTLIWFYKIMYPFIWLLNGSANAISKSFGVSPASESEVAHSEEELRILLSESLESGEINQSEYGYMNKIFEFDRRIAREIMVPRTEIISFHETTTLQEILSVVRKEGYTRYPVTHEGDKDQIIGFVNIKELLTDCIYGTCDEDEPLAKYIKPVLRIIETLAIHDLLVNMQKERVHMSILIDEYGGTAGLVTVEDILEEIVGDIRDEFDTDEIPEVQKFSDTEYVFDAKVLVDEVNDLLGTTIEHEDIDTLGGWILSQKVDVQPNDTIEEQHIVFIIEQMEGHQIQYVRALLPVNSHEETLTNPLSSS